MSVLASCASTKLREIRVDGGYAGGPVESVLVVALDSDARRRSLVERELMSRLNARGIAAVAGTGVVPAKVDTDHGSIKRKARELRIETVLVTRLISVDKERYYVSGQPMRYYGYFDPATGREYSPGTWDEVEIVRLEITLYDVATDMPIWSAASETLDPTSVEKLARSLGKEIIDDLAERRLLDGRRQRS